MWWCFVMAMGADQSVQAEIDDPQLTANDKARRRFWVSLFASLCLVVVLLWDYGFTFIFEGLSFGSIGVLLVEVLRRGNNPSSQTLVSMFVGWVRDRVLKTPREAKGATALLIFCFCFLATYYVVLPPLKFEVKVQGLDKADVGPIQLSLDQEPNKVETNPAGYASLQLRGLNWGHINFLGAYSSEKSLLLKNKRLSTLFLWRHRFEALSGPIALDISVLPSAKEKAESLYQSALILMQREDFAGAIAKLDEGLAIQGLGETERTKLLKAKELCLLWKTAPRSSKRN